ncbi:hypothetical protein QDY72_04265 [Kingella negevensis]|uniref:Outer membrane protein beta-barrel domain-containing protein n=1 Tax=Kingella negevensis TaxID=1522312 RepID=A0A238HEU0_9NEIS|nr:hypothetical protein [Kingella negevensis]MDK4684399.1 hypothetical protein [Kingella negevensis]MDK4707575.1 hypothetical protein [Kingella negevensis]MDK4709950.1 hypothetical protein [Kingella negevensis]WII93253.1 hypothetical protein QEO94_11660 [Kingella negevensis]SNB63582.1 Uncharacterised protein [Kingella negevensis]
MEMKCIKTVKYSAIVLSMLMAGSAFAEEMATESVSSGTETPAKWEVYGKAGFPGVGLGVGYGVNEKFTLRADTMTIGRVSRDFTERDIAYSADARSDKFNIQGDFFPMNNSFRLTAGLGFGRTKISASGYSVSAAEQTFKIGGKSYSVKLDGKDNVHVQMHYPKVSPYVGIGWGHNVAQRKAGTWGFTADLGMYVGRPKTNVTLSSTLNEKLVEAQAKLNGSGIKISDEDKQKAQNMITQRVDDETNKLRDRLQKYKVVPVVMFGVTYNF